MTEKPLINQLDSQGRRHAVWEVYRTDGTIIWRGQFNHGKIITLHKNFQFAKSYDINIR
jgi:hypothetical protein